MANNHGDEFMTYEMCRRLHEEFGARIDVALKAGSGKMESLEKNVKCLNDKLSTIKTWVIVTLAALVVDIVRGALVFLKVIGQ